MYLELHDNDSENSLSAGIKDLEFGYQAEEWIKETQDQEEIIRWELKDVKGGKLLAKWERKEGSLDFPEKTL